MRKVLITTTNCIEDAKITKYLGIITSNVVIGTDIISEFIASFSDFFGGKSGTYRRQLQRLYNYAIDDITEIAIKKGANGVIGLHIDFDEISGKGKSMFMVSVVGTAVCLRFESGDIEDGYKDRNMSLHELQLELFRKRWNEKPENNYPTEEEWDFIHTHEMPDLVESIYKSYAHAFNYRESGDTEGSCVKNAEVYFSNLDYSVLAEAVYHNLEDDWDAAISIINKYRLFNTKYIYNLLKSDSIDNAIYLLSAEKSYYSEDEYREMLMIVDFLDSLPDKGKIEEGKTGLLSSNKKRYYCPKGHINDIVREYCLECGLNIKGFNREQVSCIMQFKERVEVLSNFFNNNE